MKREKRKGFTLTELLVVIVVIAVLSAIAMPIYTKAITRSRAGDALKVLSLASAKQEVYLHNNDRFANNFNELGAPVKGLSGNTGETKQLGHFEFAMDNSCIVAIRTADNYRIYRNFDTQEIGCVGGGCSVIASLVPEKNVGCELKDIEDNGDGNAGKVKATLCTPTTTTTDGCDGGRIKTCGANGMWGSCHCPSGLSWNGSTCGACDEGTKPAESDTCGGGSGTQTRMVTCDSSTWTWTWGPWTCTCPPGTQLNSSGVCSSMVCTPNETRACGSGKGTAICNRQPPVPPQVCDDSGGAGTQTCNGDGSGWGPCQCWSNNWHNGVCMGWECTNGMETSAGCPAGEIQTCSLSRWGWPCCKTNCKPKSLNESWGYTCSC